MQPVWCRKIVDVVPAPAHEALVFEAVEAAAQQGFDHDAAYSRSAPAIN
jgi:hypothetical protein